jgi:GWxTD domain-containing protein
MLMLAGAAAPAAALRLEGPPPWRVGGRVGFTLDAVTRPDSSGLVMEVLMRVPPATLAQLTRGADGDARMRASFKVRGRFGARSLESEQEFTVAANDTTLGQGRVLKVRFPAAPGPCQVTARLEDQFSRKRGLIYSGRNAREALELTGAVEVPRPQAGREIGDIEFLWPTPGLQVPVEFLVDGRPRVPNPDRLFGLLGSELRVAFRARGTATDARPWQWVARVFDASGQPVAQRDSTAPAAGLLDAELAFDLSNEPAGAYDLEVKAWQEGDDGALLRRARFSVAWRPETWVRNAADITDEVHLLLDSFAEDSFAVMPPGEQERFLAEFWRLRDPDPETAVNEVQDAFRARVAHANENFSFAGLERGMFSDMGRVYIRYGEPSEVLRQVMPAGEETALKAILEIQQREDAEMGSIHQKGLGGDMRPYEVWVYEGEILQPIEADPRTVDRRAHRRRLVFLFIDDQGLGSYRLRFSTE